MAKDLISEQTLPTAITLPSTGNAKADAALAQLAVWPHSPSNPFTRPGGKDYDKARKAALAAGPAALLDVLGTEGLLEPGKSTWDDDKYARLSPAKKKEFRKASEAAATGRKIRIAFISFLVEAVLPVGYRQLLAILGNDEVDYDIRREALRFLSAEFDDRKHLMEMVKAVGVVDWDGKDADKNPLVEDAIGCWHAADPKGAYDALAKLLTPELANKRASLVSAIVGSLYEPDTKVDPRWPVALARVIATDLEVYVCMALDSLPPDPKVIPEILKALGPLDKIEYFTSMLLETVARVGTLETLPILQRAMRDDPDDAEKIIAMVPPKAKALIEALKATPVDEAEPEPPARPTLVYRKVKASKRPKLPPLATQEAQYQKLFAAAGIAEAYAKLAQRSVILFPARVDEKTLALGATKLGGHPDLPADIAWPRVRKEPLTFLAQLDLAEFAKLLPKELPATGTLAVFVDNNASSEVGAYLENAKVIYTKAGAKLVRREVPEDFVDVIYQACKCELIPKISLPSPSNAHATKALRGAILETYESEVWVDEEPLPKVLGYRDHGYDAEEPASARLLLQLPGDEQSEMEFGDAEPVSFFIGVKDLAKGNFAKVWPRCGD